MLSRFGRLVKFFFSAPPPRKDRQGESKETTERSSYKRWPQAASAVNKTNHYLRTSDSTQKDEKRWQNTGTPVLLPDRRTAVICTGFLPLHPPTPNRPSRWHFYDAHIKLTTFPKLEFTIQKKNSTSIAAPRRLPPLVQCNNRFEPHSGYTRINVSISSAFVLSARTKRS